MAVSFLLAYFNKIAGRSYNFSVDIFMFVNACVHKDTETQYILTESKFCSLINLHFLFYISKKLKLKQRALEH